MSGQNVVLPPFVLPDVTDFGAAQGRGGLGEQAAGDFLGELLMGVAATLGAFEALDIAVFFQHRHFEVFRQIGAGAVFGVIQVSGNSPAGEV